MNYSPNTSAKEEDEDLASKVDGAEKKPGPEALKEAQPPKPDGAQPKPPKGAAPAAREKKVFPTWLADKFRTIQKLPEDQWFVPDQEVAHTCNCCYMTTQKMATSMVYRG